MQAFKPLYLTLGIISYGEVLADEIPSAYVIVSQAYHVPADILYAVALTESGKDYQGKHLPWPWTLNIAGLGVYCATQDEAKALLLRKISEQPSIDIGLMQINWRWHQHRFKSFDDALLPMRNLSVGAMILGEQFNDTQDWWKAVGRYHSPGQNAQSRRNAERYRQRVHKHWRALF